MNDKDIDVLLSEILEELKLIRRAVVPEGDQVEPIYPNGRRDWEESHDPNKAYQTQGELAIQIAVLGSKFKISKRTINRITEFIEEKDRGLMFHLMNWEPKRLYEWHAYYFAEWCVKNDVEFPPLRGVGPGVKSEFKLLMKQIVDHYNSGGK